MLHQYFMQVKFKGVNLLPANGLGGSRATSSLVAHFALQNTASNPAEKNRALPEKQKGKKEEIRYEKKSSDFVNNLFNQTTGQ